jgi:hypothetical protein
MKEVTVNPDDEIIEGRDMIESQEPPCMMISHKINLAWVREIIQDAKKYGVPEGTMRQRKKPPFSNYMAFMCDLIERNLLSLKNPFRRKNGWIP